MPDLLPGLGADLFGGIGLSLSVLIYLRLVWHKHTDPAAAADDQLGVKTFCATLTITGVLMAGMGLVNLLGEILTWGNVKMSLQVSLPRVLVGAGVLGFVTQVYLPKTNHEQFPKAMRLTAGAIATIAGVAAVMALAQALTGLFMLEWKPIARALSAAVVSGGAAAGALVVLSKLSGIDLDAEDLAQGMSQMAQQAAQNIQQRFDEDEDQVVAPQAPVGSAQPQVQPQAPAPGGFQPAAPQNPSGFQPAPPQNPSGFQPAPPQNPSGFQSAPPRPAGPPPPGGFKR